MFLTVSLSEHFVFVTRPSDDRLMITMKLGQRSRSSAGFCNCCCQDDFVLDISEFHEAPRSRRKTTITARRSLSQKNSAHRSDENGEKIWLLLGDKNAFSNQVSRQKPGCLFTVYVSVTINES